MKFTRIVQITDIHLLENPDGEILGISPEKAFKEVIADALSQQVKPDLIIATGDLAEDGSQETYSSLRSILAGIDIPVFVLPGNHDSVANMQAALVSESIKMETITQTENWIIIFLNSQVEGQDYGSITPERLLELKSLLQASGDKPCLIALHHSPISGCISSTCQLQNGAEFLKLIENYKNVRAVISGHTHWSKEHSYSGCKLLTTPSTFLHVTHPQDGESNNPEDIMKSHSFDSKKRGYRLIDLFTNGTLSSEVCWA